MQAYTGTVKLAPGLKILDGCVIGDGVLQGVAVIMLQRVSVCCSVMKCAAVCYNLISLSHRGGLKKIL